MSETTGQDAAGVIADATTTAAAQPNAATTQAQTDGAEGGEGSPVAEKQFTQKEVDELIKREKAKTEAKTERRVLRTIERFVPPQQSQGQSQQQPANDGKPSRSQFANEDAYFDARDAWRDQQKEQEALGKKTETLYAEAGKLAGFDKEAFEDLPLTREIVKAVVHSDVAPRLMEFMTSNPEEVDRISKLHPDRQAAAIGRLEAKLESEPPKPKTSKAPAPITPIGAGKTPIHDLKSADHEAYRAARRQQGARWAR